MSAKRKPSVRDRLGHDRLFQVSADLPRVVELDLEALLPNPEQPRARLDEAGLEELKQSIERHGLLQPILAQPSLGGGYVLVAGQRRLAALKALGRTTVPAILVSGDPGELALVENLQRQDLDPFEEARAIARLMERHGYRQDEVGAIVGKRQSTISALLAITQLPERIRADYGSTTKVTRSQLVELAQIEDETQQLKLWELVKKGQFTVRDLRRHRLLASPAPHPPKETGSEPLHRLIGSWERLIAGFRIDPTRLEGEEELVARLRALHRSLGALLSQR